MPTVNCKPTTADSWASYTDISAEWVLAGTSDAVTAVTDSDDDTYLKVRTTVASTTPDFTAHSFSGVPAAATINSISIFWRAARSVNPGTACLRWNVKLSTNTTNGTLTKNNVSQIDVVTRPGGGSWAYADLANLKVNFECDGAGGGGNYSVYEYYLVVDYTGGGGISGFLGYTGSGAPYAVYEGGANAWFEGRVAGSMAFPNYSASATTETTGYWRVAVSTDTTFTAPVYSTDLSFTIPAGAVTNASFGNFAKITSLTTGTTYYYRVQIATDTATYTNSEDTYQSFTTLTATQTMDVLSNRLTAYCTPDSIAPANARAKGEAVTATAWREAVINWGDGTTAYQWSDLPYSGGLSRTPGNVDFQEHVYATNSTYTVIATLTGMDSTGTNSTTVVVAAPTITCTYSLTTTEDTSNNTVRMVSVTLVDGSSKNNDVTNTTYRGRTDPADPLNVRRWEITKPGAVTETYTDNPLYVTYGTDTGDIGYYGVSLTVTSVYGFTGTTASTQAFGVGYAPVDATFEAVGPRTGYTPLTVSFLNGSSGQGLSYLWNFGDSSTSTSTATTVTHSYVTSGAYTVTLTATGSTLTGTTSDSASRASYVVAVETTGTENAGGLMREIQWHLLEDPNAPPCSVFTVFGGSDEVLACLNRRLRHFCYETEIIQTETTLTPALGIYTLPADLLKLKRVEVDGYAIKSLDPLQADLSQAAWEAITTTGDIVGYMIQPQENLTIQFVPKRTMMNVVVDYVAAPATVTEPAGCYGWGLLPIPRVLAWAVKWGVIADLLNKEGEMNDPVRAKFAEDMYLLGVDLAKMLITRRRQG